MTPITDDTKWRCSGCGAESIATERTCDCPTSCLYKLGRGGTLKDGNNPSLIARIEAAEAARDEAIRLMSEASRVAGEWEGRYKAAGYPGTLDGWIERATAAEGQLAAIEEARAGKKAKEDEWTAMESASARLLLGFIVAGQTTCPPKYFDLEPNDPVYMAWVYGLPRGRREGWITYSNEYRTYSLTPAGQTALEPK